MHFFWEAFLSHDNSRSSAEDSNPGIVSHHSGVLGWINCTLKVYWLRDIATPPPAPTPPLLWVLQTQGDTPS